jgi:hypothetical protein
MSALLRGLGGWLLALAEDLERRGHQGAGDDRWHDGQAQSRVFELRTRIHAGYY